MGTLPEMATQLKATLVTALRACLDAILTLILLALSLSLPPQLTQLPPAIAMLLPVLLVTTQLFKMLTPASKVCLAVTLTLGLPLPTSSARLVRWDAILTLMLLTLMALANMFLFTIMSLLITTATATPWEALLLPGLQSLSTSMRTTT